MMYSRGIAASIIAALASLAVAQDLSQKVTFETVAAPTARVLSTLSTQTGVKFELSPSLSRDILVIHVKDVELKTLMDKVAEATSGEWKQDGDTWRLSRDAAKFNAEERKELVDRTNDVKTALKNLKETYEPKVVKQEPKPSNGGVATEQIVPGGMGGDWEANKVIVNALLRIDASLIASIEPDGRLVFTTNPTRMQRPLTIDLSSLGRIIEQHNRAALEAQKAKEDQAALSDEMQQMQEWAAKFMPGFGRKDKVITGTPTKVMLIISRGSFFTGATAELQMYDAKGGVIFESSLSIPLGESLVEQMADLSVDANGKLVEKAKPEDQKDTSPLIKLSPLAEEMTTTFSRYYGPGAEEPKLSPDLAKQLQRPDLYDPLSYDVSESILAVAANKQLNVVANVPDSIAGGFFRFMADKGKRTIDAYFKTLQSGDETTAVNSDGWLLVRPARPAEARRMRVSRSALTRLIASSSGGEIPGLDAMAAYALEAEEPQSTAIVMPYLANFAANVMQGGMMGQLSWNMLRLYATLTPSQKVMLQNGGRLNFSGLSSDQAVHVAKMIYGASARLKVDRPGDKPKEDEFSFIDMIRIAGMGGGIDFRDEPTEVMPNGLPGGGYLDMKSTSENFAVVVGEKGGTVKQYGALGTDELAILKYFSEDPNFAQVASQIPKFEHFRVGDRTSMEFKFHLAPDVSVEQTLRDDRIDRNAPVVSDDGLPSAFKARIDKRVAALKKSPFPFPMGLGQSVPPPH